METSRPESVPAVTDAPAETAPVVEAAAAAAPTAEAPAPAADKPAETAPSEPSPAGAPSEAPAAPVAPAEPASTEPAAAPIAKGGPKASPKPSKRADKLGFTPGTIVTAKLKGFPPWPAMILTEEFLPANILKMKPIGGGRRRKNAPEETKDDAPEEVSAWPVRFFNDDNYMWATRSELKLLPKATAESFVSSSKAKKDKALIQAYKIAADPPDMKAADEMDVDEPEKDEPEYEEEKPKRKPAKRKPKDTGDDEAKTPKRKRKAPEANGSAKKTPARTPAKKDKSSAVTPARKTELDRVEKSKHVLFLRHKLQKAFLTRDKAPEEDEMESMDILLTKLERFQGLEIQMIKETKINKVLKGINKLEVIPLDDKYKFRERCVKLLDDWVKWFEREGVSMASTPRPDKDASPVKVEAKTEATAEPPAGPAERKPEPAEPKAEAAEPKAGPAEPKAEPKAEPAEPAPAVQPAATGPAPTPAE
ncbi:uncharacterized protein V1510DRAFT_394441 [Dipodascopsis tothii]|uniref:uncharacterized protein n=1 Tax=Dipodascopsis tothii TaxID=44089 RepID=UPI0034CD1E39